MVDGRGPTVSAGGNGAAMAPWSSQQSEGTNRAIGDDTSGRGSSSSEGQRADDNVPFS
jgi:hypothetical protein